MYTRGGVCSVAVDGAIVGGRGSRVLPLALVLVGAKSLIVVALRNEQLTEVWQTVEVLVVQSVSLHSAE